MNRHLEILHGIVQAEQAAREDYDKAVAKQVSFESDLSGWIEQMRQEYYQKADEEIAAFESAEAAKADAEIAVLDSRHEAELRQAKEDFEEKKQAYAQRLFEIVVNQNA